MLAPAQPAKFDYPVFGEKKMLAKSFGVVCFLMVSLAASALASEPDYAREQRLKSEIVDAIFDGEPMELEAAGREFLVIDMQPDDAPKGGIIVMHGRGFHPDYENVIRPLRIGLAESGWRTVSIQMPVLDKQAKYFDYVPVLDHAKPRIDAAIAHLKAQGVERILLLAHSCGGHMAIRWLHAHGDSDLAGFIGIGLGATDYQQPMKDEFPHPKMNVPILDLYAENDFGAVKRLAATRRAGLKNPKSEQVVVPDADHYFKERGDQLVEAVDAWLNKTYE